jgi:hypothetical protein
MIAIKKLHDDVGDLGDIVNIVKFAKQIFTSSVVPDDIRILLYFAFLLHFCNSQHASTR